MKILENQTKDNLLTATILIEADEFASALQEAYQANKDKSTVSDWREEALDICIPKSYMEFARENHIAPAGQPEIVDVSWPGSGCVTFEIQVFVRPKVSPDQYKGIVVQVPADEEAAFSDAVVCEAVRRMKVGIPEAAVDLKLNAMLAEQKMQIGQDPIYNVLADMAELLKKAYQATGVSRPAAQVRSEAMDIMLQHMSGDQRELSKEHFYLLLKETVKGYRELPAGFDEKLDEIVKKRKQEMSDMTPEKRTAEAFGAYLGSLDLTEEGWLKENRGRAAVNAKFDLLLDAVGEAESIAVTPEEMEEAYGVIGLQCGIDAEQVKASIDAEPLEWQLKREKSRKLIMGSAVAKG